MCVDVGFDDIDDEGQIGIALGLAVCVVERCQLQCSVVTAVVDANHDQLEGSRLSQRVQTLVDLPLAGERRRGIEQVLTVVHIEHRVAFLRIRIAWWKIEPDRALPVESRNHHWCENLHVRLRSVRSRSQAFIRVKGADGEHARQCQPHKLLCDRHFSESSNMVPNSAGTVNVTLRPARSMRAPVSASVNDTGSAPPVGSMIEIVCGAASLFVAVIARCLPARRISTITCASMYAGASMLPRRRMVCVLRRRISRL